MCISKYCVLNCLHTIRLCAVVYFLSLYILCSVIQLVRMYTVFIKRFYHASYNMYALHYTLKRFIQGSKKGSTCQTFPPCRILKKRFQYLLFFPHTHTHIKAHSALMAPSSSVKKRHNSQMSVCITYCSRRSAKMNEDNLMWRVIQMYLCYSYEFFSSTFTVHSISLLQSRMFLPLPLHY